jgi:hypothetical protein
VLDHIARGDTVPLTRLTSSDIERDGGNGGQEIRNWRAGDVGRLYELGANPYLIRRVFRPRFTI